MKWKGDAIQCTFLYGFCLGSKRVIDIFQLWSTYKQSPVLILFRKRQSVHSGKHTSVCVAWYLWLVSMIGEDIAHAWQCALMSSGLLFQWDPQDRLSRPSPVATAGTPVRVSHPWWGCITEPAVGECDSGTHSDDLGVNTLQNPASRFWQPVIGLVALLIRDPLSLTPQSSYTVS